MYSTLCLKYRLCAIPSILQSVHLRALLSRMAPPPLVHRTQTQVILIGLYNGQRLGDEPPEDIVTYTRAIHAHPVPGHVDTHTSSTPGGGRGGSGDGVEASGSVGEGDESAHTRNDDGGSGGGGGGGAGAHDHDQDHGCTFVRLLLLRGRVMGAVLLGETDLEEAMENIILDGLDVSSFGPHLLDPDFDLDSAFD